MMSWVRLALHVALVAEVLHEVADGEVGGAALPAVAELLAVPQRFVVGYIEVLDFVPDAGQGRASRGGRGAIDSPLTSKVV